MSRPLTETEYRLLVDHSPVMIWRAGLDSNCDYFNDTWLTFTGRTLAQEVGEGWAEGVHPDDLGRCVDYYLDHFRRRAPFEMEYRLRRHDGAFRWIFDRGVPFNNEKGTFAGFIGSCVDVDERRRSQEARQKSDAEQLALARDFERWILAIVSHDIRNPLGVIRLAAHHLEHAVHDPVAVKRDLERLLRGTDRIQHIVADLLDLSRERDGSGISVTVGQADLGDICRQVIDELEDSAKGRRIELECTSDVSGAWDKHRIIQAVSNLTANAIQHGAPGSSIQVTVSGDAERVVVAVGNQGVIPAELLPVIFDPFRSRRETRSRGEGLGLGLFIAKAIASAHKGHIEVESSAERGTIFRLVLPRTSAASP